MTGHLEEQTDVSLDIAVETITPDQASKYLEANQLNRNISSRTVNRYASDLRAGNWRLVGDPIRFDHKGQLLDGQHRLHACVAAEVPLESVVVRGLDPSDRGVVDSGRKRTGSNVLEMAGLTHSATLMASVAAMGCFDDAGKLLSNTSRVEQPTHSELLAWAQEHLPNITEPYRPAMRAYNQFHGSCTGYVYAGYKLYQANPKEALNFLEDIAELHTEGKGDPRAALLRRLQALGNTPRMKAKPTQTVFAFVTAWNAHRTREELLNIPALDKSAPMPEVIR